MQDAAAEAAAERERRAAAERAAAAAEEAVDALREELRSAQAAAQQEEWRRCGLCCIPVSTLVPPPPLLCSLSLPSLFPVKNIRSVFVGSLSALVRYILRQEPKCSILRGALYQGYLPDVKASVLQSHIASANRMGAA